MLHKLEYRRQFINRKVPTIEQVGAVLISMVFVLALLFLQ